MGRKGLIALALIFATAVTWLATAAEASCPAWFSTCSIYSVTTPGAAEPGPMSNLWDEMLWDSGEWN